MATDHDRPIVGNGAYADAIGWGIEMAQLRRIDHRDTDDLRRRVHFGPFGQVTWIRVTADAAAVDAAGQARRADADYMGRLGAIGELFVPGSGLQALATRVA